MFFNDAHKAARASLNPRMRAYTRAHPHKRSGRCGGPRQAERLRRRPHASSEARPQATSRDTAKACRTMSNAPDILRHLSNCVNVEELSAEFGRCGCRIGEIVARCSFNLVRLGPPARRNWPFPTSALSSSAAKCARIGKQRCSPSVRCCCDARGSQSGPGAAPERAARLNDRPTRETLVEPGVQQ